MGARPRRRMKAPLAIREEAYELAQIAAEEREKDGDPEGADVLRDLAESIKGIRLTELA